jgi:hypothetical protein
MRHSPKTREEQKPGAAIPRDEAGKADEHGEGFPYVDRRRAGEVGLELASLAVAGVAGGRRRVRGILGALVSHYDHLASLPLRYLYDRSTGGVTANFPLPIAFWGYRWNRTARAASEWAYAARLVGDQVRRLVSSDADRLKLAEYVAMPSSEKTDRMDRQMQGVSGLCFVVEDPELALAHKRRGHPALLEVYPGLHMSASELEEFAEANGIGLAYDTWHIRHDLEPHQRAEARDRAGSAARNKLGDWEEEIERLLPLAGLVHFQPSRRKEQKNELEATLAGERTELAAMTEAIRELGYPGPIVVEHLFPVADQLLRPDRVVARAVEISQYIRQNLWGRPASGPTNAQGA